MEQQKPNNSDSPDSGGGSRSYECTFCKRGFTNAQALGGHMNIHRKHNPKSKAKLTRFPQPDPPPKALFGGHVNYQLYFTSSNRCIQTRNYFPVTSVKDPIRVAEEEDGSELDLELRLGQYP